jgi:hypothetical protein
VKQAQRDGTVHPDNLLHLWMGNDRGSGSPPGRQRQRIGVTVLTASIAVIAAALMAKFAIDLLAIVLALVGAGIVLHVLGISLAESDILSPGWLLIILLGIALFAYAFLVPAESVAGLGRYMPKWMITGLERSEQHGWAQRAFTGPGGAGTAPVTVEPPPASDRADYSSPAPPSLVLSASSQATTPGQAVTLMARTGNTDNGSENASVRFYDGGTLLGAADLKTEGRTRIAYLTVRGLAAGTHEIRAELVGPPGGWSGISEPLRITIVSR